VQRTQVVLPNTPVQHGQAIQIGDVTFRMHHYGTAHQAALFVCRIARLNKSTGIKPTSTKAKLGRAASPSLSSLAS